MEIIIQLLILFGLLIFAIKFHNAKNTAASPKIYSREFTITKQQPTVEYEGVEFVSVEKNGTSTVKTTFSGEVLEAREKEFFQGKDYGFHGLQLISSSYIKQKMLLKHFVPEDVDVE